MYYQKPIEIRDLLGGNVKIVAKVPPTLKPFVEVKQQVQYLHPVLQTVYWNPENGRLD